MPDTDVSPAAKLQLLIDFALGMGMTPSEVRHVLDRVMARLQASGGQLFDSDGDLKSRFEYILTHMLDGARERGADVWYILTVARDDLGLVEGDHAS